MLPPAAIAEDVRLDRGVIDATIPPVALEMFDTGHRDRVYYRVDTAEGRLLTGYPDLPLPRGTPKEGVPLHFSRPLSRPELAPRRAPVSGGGRP